MTAIITQKFRQHISNLFKSDVEDLDVTKNLYLFIGKPLPWPISDELPPLPEDSFDNQKRIWDEIIALKKIKEAGVFNIIPRHDWDETGDTVYVAYRDTDAEIFKHPTDAEILAGQAALVPYTAGSFYVITDEYHVFKCLDNAGGEKSTVKPQKPLTAPFVYAGADGYRWKYMFTVPSNQVELYLTDAWIPLQTLTADDGSDQWDVQQDAITNTGQILSTIVLNGGTNYTNVQDSDPENPDIQLAVSATLNTIVLSAAASGANNAYNGATIWITNGLGSGQHRTITSYIGATKEATLDSNWSTIPDNTSEYQVLPTITITGNGSGALAKPVVVGGVLTRVEMINTGLNYSFASSIVSGAGGSGALVEAQVGPGAGHGSDAIAELGGSYLMLRVALEYDEGAGDFPVVNDYRMTGIIKNVENFGGGISTDDTLNALTKLQLSTTTGTFLSDELITGSISTANGNIVQFEDLGSNTGSITFVQNAQQSLNSFGVGETVTGALSGATALITAIDDPEAEKFSGELLTLEHRRPITRAPDQKETVKFILRF
jgi:hypothetical protein